MSTENSPSSRPSYDDKRRNDRDCELTGRQNNLGDASQTLVASSSLNQREKETPMRDVKGKRKADEIEITPLIDNSIVEPNLVQLPVATENYNEPEGRTQDIIPIRKVRVPRNRTLLDSVKAHLAISGEGARQDSVPSLLTRLSDPHVNSRKARHMGDNQQNAGDNDHLRHSRLEPSSSRSQDSKASFKNNNVSLPEVLNRSPPITMSAARPIVRQNSVATSTVEDNTMAIPSYQRILSRSLPVPSNSQNQVDNGNNLPSQVHDQQIPPHHVQQPSSIAVVGLIFPSQTRPVAHSTTLTSDEPRARLLARLEIEKRQVVQLAATEENNNPPQPLDDIPSSFARTRRKRSHLVDDCDSTLKRHEREPGVLELASDSLVSEESRKRESKLRARAQLRVRLAAEKRLSG